MEAMVEDLLSAVMKLPAESRTDLVEAILERSTPSDAFVAEQIEIVSERMDRVRQGVSQPVGATEAHSMVLSGLHLRA